LFERAGIELADLYLAIVPPDSYLYKAGLRPGDKILRLDEELVPAWFTFEERVKAAPTTAPHRFSGGARRSCAQRYVQIRREGLPRPSGQRARITSFRSSMDPAVAEDASTIRRRSATRSPRPSKDGGRHALHARSASCASAGALEPELVVRPLAIYEIAGEEGRKGADNFVWVMALLSINLGLSPAADPVLDGGHSCSCARRAMRQPLPLRTRELMHIVGMAILRA